MTGRRAEIGAPCAPGARAPKAVASRWALFICNGRFAYVSFSITRPSVAVDVSSTGGAEVTSTVSVASPTVNTGLKLNTERAFTARFTCFIVLNPLASTVKEYVPGGRGAMVNKPADDDVRTVAIFVATLVAITVAFGTVAPVLSVTVPEIVPSPAVCPLSPTGLAIDNVAASRRNAVYSVFAKLPRKMLVLKCMINLDRNKFSCKIARFLAANAHCTEFVLFFRFSFPKSGVGVLRL